MKKGMNAHCSVPDSVEKKGEDADVRAPRCSERERGNRAPTGGPYCAVRGEKRGRARGLTARSGPRHWAVRVSRARGGTLGRHGPKPGVSARVCWARVWGWARFSERNKIKEKLFYIFQSCKFV